MIPEADTTNIECDTAMHGQLQTAFASRHRLPALWVDAEIFPAAAMIAFSESGGIGLRIGDGLQRPATYALGSDDARRLAAILSAAADVMEAGYASERAPVE